MLIQKLKNTAVLVSVAILCISTAPLMAHHSHAMFDADKEITISGKVAGLRYANPHIRLLVEIENEAGEAERWDIEMSTIVNMRSRGVNRDTFPQGGDISLSINPLRDGGHGGNLVRIHSVSGVDNGAEGGRWEPAS